MLIGAGKMGEARRAALRRAGASRASSSRTARSTAPSISRASSAAHRCRSTTALYLPLADVVLGSVTTSGYLFGPSQLHGSARARRRGRCSSSISACRATSTRDQRPRQRLPLQHRRPRQRRRRPPRRAGKRPSRPRRSSARETERFWRVDLSRRDVTPTIVALRGSTASARTSSSARSSRCAARADERRALEAMTQAIVNKILHPPLMVA